MNIVKINDILLPEEFKMSKFFNEQLKGKYAYWIKMRYIFPLDSLDYKTYIKYEQLDNSDFSDENILPHIDMYNEECCMIDFVDEFVDICETEKINGVNKYLVANEYTTDYNIDISKLRNFRSWLAEQLICLNSGINNHDLGLYTSEQHYMLEYYKNCMYNDVVKQLLIFGKDNTYVVNSNISRSNCSCVSNNIYNFDNAISCDGLSIYRKNIHNLMVETFSNVDFWKQFDKDFIKMFKLYIDNIIKVGFIINNSENTLVAECECNYTNNSNNEKLLKNLSLSLEYILNNEISGHKNFIYDSLYNWSEYLYDYMFWN